MCRRSFRLLFDHKKLLIRSALVTFLLDFVSVFSGGRCCFFAAFTLLSGGRSNIAVETFEADEIEEDEKAQSLILSI